MPPAVTEALWGDLSAAGRAAGHDWRFALTLADATGTLDTLVFGEEAYKLLVSVGVGTPCDLRANVAMGAALDATIGALFHPSAYLELCVTAYYAATAGGEGGGQIVRFRLCNTRLTQK